MKRQAWPFLITRNKTSEYRVVIIPQFLYSTHLTSFLMEALEERITPAEHAVYREISNLGNKDVTLIFRMEMAREHHLGLNTKELLYDQQNRPIYFTEGLVFEGTDLDINVTGKLFNNIHQNMQKRYKLFWDSTNNPPLTFSSQCLTVETVDNTSKHFQLTVLSPLKIPSVHPHPTQQESPVVPLDPKSYNNDISLFVGISIATLIAIISFIFIKIAR